MPTPDNQPKRCGWAAVESGGCVRVGPHETHRVQVEVGPWAGTWIEHPASSAPPADDRPTGHYVIDPDGTTWQQRTTTPPADDLVQRLRERFTGEPVPPCRVCGVDLEVQSIGGGHATKYACLQEGGAKKFSEEWMDHYRRSEFVHRRPGDSEVLEVLDRLVAIERERDALQRQVCAARALADEWGAEERDDGEFSMPSWAYGDLLTAALDAAARAEGGSS